MARTSQAFMINQKSAIIKWVGLIFDVNKYFISTFRKCVLNDICEPLVDLTDTLCRWNNVLLSLAMEYSWLLFDNRKRRGYSRDSISFDEYLRVSPHVSILNRSESTDSASISFFRRALLPSSCCGINDSGAWVCFSSFIAETMQERRSQPTASFAAKELISFHLFVRKLQKISAQDDHIRHVDILGCNKIEPRNS